MPTEKAGDNVSPVEESRGSISCEEKYVTPLPMSTEKQQVFASLMFS